MHKLPTIYPNLQTVSAPFPALLLDAFGVFWAGNSLGPILTARTSMQESVEAGKIVGILSNSTQPSSKEIAKLAQHGILQNSHFHFMVTSGDVARRLFLQNNFPFQTRKQKYFLFGEFHPKYSSHISIFHGTLFEETSSIHEADFLYINVPHIGGEDQTEAALFKEAVDAIRHHNLPMVCANPDRFAHEGSPARAVVRQGSIAHMYEEMGHEVYYIGKPYKAAYELAFEQFCQLNIQEFSEILMVGDTPETDIRGARLMGMPSALITETGILSDRIRHNGLEKAIQDIPRDDYPDFFIERL